MARMTPRSDAGHPPRRTAPLRNHRCPRELAYGIDDAKVFCRARHAVPLQEQTRRADGKSALRRSSSLGDSHGFGVRLTNLSRLTKLKYIVRQLTTSEGVLRQFFQSQPFG